MNFVCLLCPGLISLDGTLHKFRSGSGTARVHSIMCELAGYTGYVQGICKSSE
jgi:hypothetical protein